MSDLSANKQLLIRMTQAVNDRDLDALDDVIAADLVRHCQATPDVVVESLDDFKAFLQQDFATVPDSVIEVRQILAEDDLVSVWMTYSGTQEGPMGPFPPTGKRFSVDFASHLRIADGKIAEMWVIWDNLYGLVQLGHIDPGA
jgi:steroid delta-isomerase-like uncharacterized protein